MKIQESELTYPKALSIAGSDSTGGAGLQADIKTFSALGVYGMTAVVAVVNESTMAVNGVHPVPVDFVCGQIHSILGDIGADAVKTGMLFSREHIDRITETLVSYGVRNLVVDPVMVSSSRTSLLQPDAVEAMRHTLIPRATIITPNIPEAELLYGSPITQDNMEEAARALSQGKTAVLIKGGHLDNATVLDLLYLPATDEVVEFRHPKIRTVNTRGTGCSLSSAITALLARGLELKDAVSQALDYVHESIAVGSRYRVGHGCGPIHHFHRWWK